MRRELDSIKAWFRVPPDCGATASLIVVLEGDAASRNRPELRETSKPSHIKRNPLSPPSTRSDSRASRCSTRATMPPPVHTSHMTYDLTVLPIEAVLVVTRQDPRLD